MVTIREVLRNADFNLMENGNIPFAREIAKEQLHNAMILINDGYGLDDEFDKSFDEYQIKIGGNHATE